MGSPLFAGKNALVRGIALSLCFPLPLLQNCIFFQSFNIKIPTFLLCYVESPLQNWSLPKSVFIESFGALKLIMSALIPIPPH